MPVLQYCCEESELIDSYFILSNSRTTFAGKELLIRQESKLKKGPETQPGFFLILTVIASNCDTLAGDTSTSVQGKEKFRAPFHERLLILKLT